MSTKRNEAQCSYIIPLHNNLVMSHKQRYRKAYSRCHHCRFLFSLQSSVKYPAMGMGPLLLECHGAVDNLTMSPRFVNRNNVYVVFR